MDRALQAKYHLSADLRGEDAHYLGELIAVFLGVRSLSASFEGAALLRSYFLGGKGGSALAKSEAINSANATAVSLFWAGQNLASPTEVGLLASFLYEGCGKVCARSAPWLFVALQLFQYRGKAEGKFTEDKKFSSFLQRKGNTLTFNINKMVNFSAITPPLVHQAVKSEPLTTDANHDGCMDTTIDGLKTLKDDIKAYEEFSKKVSQRVAISNHSWGSPFAAFYVPKEVHDPALFFKRWDEEHQAKLKKYEEKVESEQSKKNVK